MEAQDFEMPSPKRQRTTSPSEPRASAAVQATAQSNGAAENNAQIEVPSNTALSSGQAEASEPGAEAIQGDRDMLDVLMQHVEAETTSQPRQIEPDTTTSPAQHDGSLSKETNDDVKMETDCQPAEPLPFVDGAQVDTKKQQQQQQQQEPVRGSQNMTDGETGGLPPGLTFTGPPDIAHLQAVAEVNGLPPTSDNLVEGQVPPATSDTAAPAEPEQREWETDSSPYDSSDSETSSDSSSEDDDDDDDVDEYTLLDPYEQARILMAEDGGGGGADSDEEGGSRPHRSTGGNAGAGVRTTNEQMEAILPKPDITVTEDMTIEELGAVEAIVENIVLIKAKTSGEYQVLESGSVLCLADRKVVGAVSETLGRVEAPMYTVRFASATDIAESGVGEKGAKVYYVRDHSTFVFTQPLKAVKGSDASNLHDEEVGDDEMEFSDDEAEAEHKRQIKLRRKGIDPSTVPPPSRGGRGPRPPRGSAGRGGGRSTSSNYMSSNAEPDAFANGSMEMNYDDVEEGETEYTPLKRPQTMASISQTSPASQRSPRGSFPQNRGSRGRNNNNNNNNNNNRGRGRGGNNNRGNYMPTSATSMYAQTQSQPQTQYYASAPQQQAYFGFQPPPPPPQLTPSGGFSENAMPPSPMTPLPGPGPTNYNFHFAAAASNQWQLYHQNQNTQFQAQQAYGGQYNADAIAQVQRQLEELRRQSQGGSGQR